MHSLGTDLLIMAAKALHSASVPMTRILMLISPPPPRRSVLSPEDFLDPVLHIPKDVLQLLHHGVIIDQELIDWIDLMIEKRVFANRSRGVEACIQWAKDGFERGELPPR